MIAELRSREYISMIVEPGLYTIFMHPQSLVSGTGSLNVRAEDRSIMVETSTNRASYLEVKVPSGHGNIDVHAKIRQENKALPKLKDLRPW